MTPIMMPRMEMPVIIEMKPCFLFALRYRREKKVSKDIEVPKVI
jgi:hypothetical protein